MSNDGPAHGTVHDGAPLVAICRDSPEKAKKTMEDAWRAEMTMRPCSLAKRSFLLSSPPIVSYSLPEAGTEIEAQYPAESERYHFVGSCSLWATVDGKELIESFPLYTFLNHNVFSPPPSRPAANVLVPDPEYLPSRDADGGPLTYSFWEGLGKPTWVVGAFCLGLPEGFGEGKQYKDGSGGGEGKSPGSVGHWVLALTHLGAKTAVYWDSVNDGSKVWRHVATRRAEELGQMISSAYGAIFNPDLATKDLLLCPAQSYIQDDGWTCGLYCIVHAIMLTYCNAERPHIGFDVCDCRPWDVSAYCKAVSGITVGE